MVTLRDLGRLGVKMTELNSGTPMRTCILSVTFVSTRAFDLQEQFNRESDRRALRGVFFVSRRFASRIHEISDLKKTLVLSLRAGFRRLRDQTKKTH